MARPISVVDFVNVDPISAMFFAPDHAARQALLPDAVEQAAEVSRDMRATIATWLATTDAGAVRLVEQIRDSVDTLEAFARALGRQASSTTRPG